MIREEAKERFFTKVHMMSCVVKDMVGRVDALFINRKDVLNEVDKIYDEFESRKCSNCKYSYYHGDSIEKYDCTNKETPLYNDVYSEYLAKDFGCNKWEAKDD